MERSLQLFSDGRLYELVEDQAIKMTETQGQVSVLIDALQFTAATTFALAPPDQQPPEIAVSRQGTKHIHAEGTKLLTTFEGYELMAYDDGTGVWTIGYGHTGSEVHSGLKISQAQAEQLLQKDLERFEAVVEDAVKVDIDGDQFAALVSFCFNLGPTSLLKSTLLNLLNQGKMREAAQEFPRWNKADDQPLLGLTRRRLAERALFLSSSWEPFRDYDKLELSNPPKQGNFVRYVQERLNQSGFKLQVTGVFDLDTEKAVRLFQKQQQLDADGIVGLETTKRLC